MAATASWLTWTQDSKKILIAEYVDGTTAIHEMNTDGTIGNTHDIFLKGSILSGDFGMQFSISSDGNTLAFIQQSFDKPPEVWAGKSGEWKQITHRNDGLRPAWGKSVSLHWKTDAGKVQGWLTYPSDFDPAKKYPMVVRVHGGPSWAVTPVWPTRWDYVLALPSQGYFVLQPNPRGSYGQGEKFTAANVKDFGYGDFRDIMAGVDEAIKSAPIDPDRIGLTGWSYGGYMTMWGVTQTNRFRAAVAGAGLSDWLSYYGENKIDQWMTPFFGATVYDDPAVYAKSSPITFIKNVKTPTLVVVGDSDGECPPPQSYEFWHALKNTWCADTIRDLSTRRSRVCGSSAQPRRDRAGGELVQSVPANFAVRSLKSGCVSASRRRNSSSGRLPFFCLSMWPVGVLALKLFARSISIDHVRNVVSNHCLASVQRGEEGAYVPLDRNYLPCRRWNE